MYIGPGILQFNPSVYVPQLYLPGSMAVMWAQKWCKPLTKYYSSVISTRYLYTSNLKRS